MPSSVRLFATVYAGLPRAALRRQARSDSSRDSSLGERSAGGDEDFEVRRFDFTSSSSGDGSQESGAQTSQQRPSGSPGVESPKWLSSRRRRQSSPNANDSTARYARHDLSVAALQAARAAARLIRSLMR